MAEIRLTTGGIGTGKTYLNVKNVDDALKEGTYKKIYSNIRGHAERCDGVDELPSDWRDCEAGSLIIIDECQAHEKFSKHFSNRRDAEIVDLTMIRHNHLDMWLISPNPTLVNKDVRDLVNTHVCLEAVGKKTTKAYCFDKVQLNLTKQTKARAFDEFVYQIEEKYGNMYMSTADGKPSKRTYHINMKLISFIIGICIIVLIIASLVFYLVKDTGDKVNKIASSENVDNNSSSAVLNVDSVLSSDDKKVLNVDVECRKAVNVDKLECIEYFNNLTRNNMSVNSMSMNTSVSYDPNNPFDHSEIQKNIKYEVTQKPVFAGCSKMNAKYVAYTQQATVLHEVTEADCKRLLENNDRPFDYFKKDVSLIAPAQVSDLPASSPVVNF